MERRLGYFKLDSALITMNSSTGCHDVYDLEQQTELKVQKSELEYKSPFQRFTCLKTWFLVRRCCKNF